MDQHTYKGHVITTHALQCDEAWRGSFQIDGGASELANLLPASFDECGALADALGQAMRAIDTQRLRPRELDLQQSQLEVQISAAEKRSASPMVA
jgi:hypothetical protein